MKFDNFSKFQCVISHSPPPPSVIMTLCVRKSICDSPLNLENNSSVCNAKLRALTALLDAGVEGLWTISFLVKSTYFLQTSVSI